MGNKAVIGIVVVIIVVVAGFFLVYNKSNKQSYSPSYKPQRSTQGVQKPTAPVTKLPSPSPTSTTAKEQNVITLTRSGFSPSTLTVKAGTKVTWINKSGSQAAVNSNPHPVHTAYPSLNLGSFSNGSSFALTFSKVGTYGYHNHLNPSQLGTIIVQ